ncbi:MAG: hypothetical protein E7246_07325 [Lachnoclostridium sp.]|nr:hypothetical protein [Lachnoclostridium sp.]
MKRILKMSLIMAMLSVLFTGCNSIILSVGENDFEEIPWEVMEPTDDEVPDVYKDNNKNKFENLKGERAFKIKDGHSEASGDISDFQIGTLLDNGTFIYAYSTKEAGVGDNRKTVHCMATYNYKTGAFRVIHENVFISTDEDEESFYIQLCDLSASRGSDMFVYDNGFGYIYSASGELQFQTDIETFVREHFSKAYSVTTTNALTDGNDRIYLELTVEKEKVDLNLDESSAGPETEEEAEALAKELDDKVREIVLVYDFKELDTTIDFVNSAVSLQAMLWQALGKSQVYETEPDAEADWERVQEETPDNWGTAFLDNLDDLQLNTWRLNKSFISTDGGYICTFIPMVGNTTSVTDVNEEAELKDVFVLYNGQYYEVFGNVGTFKIWQEKNETFSREYYYRYYTTETDAEGREVKKEHLETKTQTITVPTWKYASLDGEYMEGYRVLTEISQIAGVVKDKLLCVADGHLVWRKKDGTYEMFGLASILDMGNYLLDVGYDKENLYVLISTKDKTLVVNGNLSERKVIEGSKIANALTPGQGEQFRIDQKYHDEHAEREKEYMGDLAGIGSAERLSAEKIVKANVHVDQNLLKELEDKGIQAGYGKASGDGYLLTTFTKGLVFYDFGSEIATCLDDGTWYQTWKKDNAYISVGFSNGEASYGTLDVAFARVYEYSPNELYQSALNQLRLEMD